MSDECVEEILGEYVHRRRFCEIVTFTGRECTCGFVEAKVAIQSKLSSWKQRAEQARRVADLTMAAFDSGDLDPAEPALVSLAEAVIAYRSALDRRGEGE